MKKILLAIVLIFVILQFFRPEKNVSDGKHTQDISTVFAISVGTQEILSVACFDCHSNSTRYPWYAEIQPVGWWLDGHIRDGKRQLNFSEFGSYRPRRQYRKLEEIAELVESGEMPPSSYRIAHADARLTGEEKDALIRFASEARKEMEHRYSADSLRIQRR